MKSPIRVAAISDIPPGTRRCLEVEGRQITVLNVQGTFHALENNCPHRGGPVGEGDVEGDTITCPWHGWSFRLATGQSTDNPAAIIPIFACQVAGDDILIDLA